MALAPDDLFSLSLGQHKADLGSVVYRDQLRTETWPEDCRSRHPGVRTRNSMAHLCLTAFRGEDHRHKVFRSVDGIQQ